MGYYNARRYSRIQGFSLAAAGNANMVVNIWIQLLTYTLGLIADQYNTLPGLADGQYTFSFQGGTIYGYPRMAGKKFAQACI